MGPNNQREARNRHGIANRVKKVPLRKRAPSWCFKDENRGDAKCACGSGRKHTWCLAGQQRQKSVILIAAQNVWCFGSARRKTQRHRSGSGEPAEDWGGWKSTDPPTRTPSVIALHLGHSCRTRKPEVIAACGSCPSGRHMPGANRCHIPAIAVPVKRGRRDTALSVSKRWADREHPSC